MQALRVEYVKLKKELFRPAATMTKQELTRTIETLRLLREKETRAQNEKKSIVHVSEERIISFL